MTPTDHPPATYEAFVARLTGVSLSTFVVPKGPTLLDPLAHFQVTSCGPEVLTGELGAGKGFALKRINHVVFPLQERSR